MRQISIKELNKHLSAEMSDLPFAVTKRSKVIGVMIALGTTQGTDLTLEDITPELKGTDKKVNTTIKSTDKAQGTDNSVETAKGQLVDIIKKRQKVSTLKATSPTGETLLFGYSKKHQTGKK